MYISHTYFYKLDTIKKRVLYLCQGKSQNINLMKINKPQSKTDKLKGKFLKEFANSLGIVQTACKKVRISRQTYYNWKDTDEAFKLEAENIIEEQTDFVENKLIERISEGDTTAIIFYLKTKGKERGYGLESKVKQEIDIDGKKWFLELMKNTLVDEE